MTNMRKAFVAILFLSSLSAGGLSTEKNNSPTDKDVRILKDHPAVYITFERFGKSVDIINARIAESGEASKPIEKGEDIRLRLHNNTRWAIEFPTWSMYIGKKDSLYRLSDGSNVFGLNDDQQVNVLYRVLESDGRYVPYGGDSFSHSWLPPGRSIIFSVNRNHLSNSRSIYVLFNYERESQLPPTEGGGLR